MEEVKRKKKDSYLIYRHFSKVGTVSPTAAQGKASLTPVEDSWLPDVESYVPTVRTYAYLPPQLPPS